MTGRRIAWGALALLVVSCIGCVIYAQIENAMRPPLLDDRCRALIDAPNPDAVARSAQPADWGSFLGGAAPGLRVLSARVYARYPPHAGTTVAMLTYSTMFPTAGVEHVGISAPQSGMTSSAVPGAEVLVLAYGPPLGDGSPTTPLDVCLVQALE